jgi:hypothetical protein
MPVRGCNVAGEIRTTILILLDLSCYFTTSTVKSMDIWSSIETTQARMSTYLLTPRSHIFPQFASHFDTMNDKTD